MLERESDPPQRRQEAGIVSMQFLSGDTARSARLDTFGRNDSEEAWKAHLEEVWKDVLGELWREIAEQLASPDSHESVVGNDSDEVLPGSEFNHLPEHRAESSASYGSALSPIDFALDHASWLATRQSHFEDYARGALIAFNPIPICGRSYTCTSDMGALLADWSAVRNDMVAGWAALANEKPVMRDLLRSTARGWKDVRRAGSK